MIKAYQHYLRIPAYFLPLRTRFALRVLALQVLVLMVWRVGFGAYFFDPQDAYVTLSNISKAFWLGTRFDLRFAIITIMPFLILGCIPWLDVVKSQKACVFWQAVYTLCFVMVAVIHFADLGNYAYVNARFSAALLEFTQTLAISAQFVWQTYPVLWLASLIVLLGWGYWWILRRFVFSILNPSKTRSNPDTFQQKPAFLRTLLAGAGLWVGLIFLAHSSVSSYPLRWSNAFFTPSSYVTALGLNPTLFFFDTLGSRAKAYKEDVIRKNYPLLASYLGVAEEERTPLHFVRSNPPKAHFTSPPNIVVIILESFAHYILGANGNPLEPTPNIDRMLLDSIVFNRFFTPTPGTARSVFAFMTGIPDIAVHRTSSRNPALVNQHLLLNAFQGYDPMYFIGGSASWGNLRGLLKKNIPRLTLYEGSTSNLPKVDVWGISDLDLLFEANKQWRRKKKPFFAVLQTSGSHRPYTIPKKNMGFQKKSASARDLRDSGFRSVAEYNAFRFLDFSLGKFFTQARKEAYFKNTLFVIFGDHGLHGTNKNLPTGYLASGLSAVHVPLILYAPKLIRSARVINTPASELDVMPTLAGLVGVPYKNRTLGRDLFAIERDREVHYAPYFYPSDAMNMGLVGKRFILRIQPDEETSLHDTQRGSLFEDVSLQHPELFEHMETLGRALYEMAHYLPWHNPPLP